MRRQRAAVERHHDIALSRILRLGQDPVGKALDGRSGHIALQLLDRRSIGECKLPRHDPREYDILIENGADALRGDQQHARSRERTGGVQIGLIADHGRKDEGRDGIDQGYPQLSAILFGEDLDQAIDQDMEEVGGPLTAVTTSRSPRTCSSASSSLPRRTGSGSPASPTSRPIRAGFIWPPSWISTAAKSSAGRWQIICAPHFHWRLWRWPL